MKIWRMLFITLHVRWGLFNLIIILAEQSYIEVLLNAEVGLEWELRKRLFCLVLGMPEWQ